MEPGVASQCLPIHYLGTSPFLGTSSIERECSLGGWPAPIPHLRPLGIKFLAQPALPFLFYHAHMFNTWVNRTAGGSLAWHSPLHLSPPLNLGNQEGIFNERGWSAHTQTIPEFQGINRWSREQMVSPLYEKGQRQTRREDSKGKLIW